MAQYPHPQPYPGLAPPQLGLGGQSYTHRTSEVPGKGVDLGGRRLNKQRIS